MDVTLPGIDGLDATRRIRALAGAAGRNADYRHFRPQRSRRRGSRARGGDELLFAQTAQPERAERGAGGNHRPRVATRLAFGIQTRGP